MSYQIKSNNIIINPNKQYKILTIKDCPLEDRPREKLLKLGVESLSSSELLALVLNTGTKKEDVLSMANRVLKEYGPNAIINEKNPQRLKKEFSLPLVKACQIVACFELGKRFFKESQEGTTIIRNAKQAFNFLKDISQSKKENFKGLYLNSRYKLIHSETISIGTVDTSIIHPREVFRPAIEHGTSAVIVAHNHPSGTLKASPEDLEVTAKLQKAGELLGIELLDHLIISKNKFISLV
jgi:DNA repair protein RadC